MPQRLIPGQQTKKMLIISCLIADSLVTKYQELGEVVTALASRNIDSDYEKYRFFFENRFGGRSGLDEFIATKQKEVQEQLNIGSPNRNSG